MTMIINYELERMIQQVRAYFKILSQHLPREPEESHKTPVRIHGNHSEIRNLGFQEG